MKIIDRLVNKNIAQTFFTSLFKRSKEKPLPPLITISREMGSGGRPIAKMVAKKMGKPWKLWHGEIITEIAKKAKLQEKFVREIDEKIRSKGEDFVDSLLGKRYLTLSSYHRHLIEVLSLIGAKGYAVIMGRGANFIFPHAFNVRVISPKKQRIAWEVEVEKLTAKEAKRRIEKSDKERAVFVHELYQKDVGEPLNYDMIIRTTKELDVDLAADMIVAAARRKFRILGGKSGKVVKNS